jgi:hypothetical protein
MDTTFTSVELRIAARQALTIAFMSFCPEMRRSLLLRAESLLAEADALESDPVSLAPVRVVAALSPLGSPKSSRNHGIPINRH